MRGEARKKASINDECIERKRKRERERERERERGEAVGNGRGKNESFPSFAPFAAQLLL
jgi:hypothetical protein